MRMSAWTVDQARAKLQLWMDADDAVATGQSYSIDLGGTKRSLSRADAGVIQERIKYWRSEVNRLENGSAAPRVRGVILHD